MPKGLDGYRAWLWLVLLCAALFLPGIAAMPPTDRDEARFAQATRQMLETGDLIRIRFQDEARNKKPAGIYWLQAGAVAAFSAPESRAMWPYRLPSVLGALAAVLLTFAAGRVLFGDRRTAFLAAAIMASCLLLVIEAHIAKTDAMLLATIVAAQFALARVYVRAREDEDAGWPTALLFWAALGVGVLIKGPLTPLVAGLTIAGLKVLDRPTRLLRPLRPLVGVPLAVAIFLPWVIAIIGATGGGFVSDAVGKDLLPKLIGGQESHGFPPGYYLLLMTATFWPGSLFAWTALVWAWKWRADPVVKFLIAWIVPTWILMEIVPTKLPHYILPVYPALALLTARAIAAVEEGTVDRLRHWLTRFAYVAWAVLIVVFTAAVAYLPLGADGRFDAVALLPLIVAAVIVAAVLRQVWQTRAHAGMVTAIVGAVLIFGPVLQFVLPASDAVWLSRSAARAVDRHTSATMRDPKIAATGYREPSLVFYLGTGTRFAQPDGVAAFLGTTPGAAALVSDRQRPAFDAALRELGISVRRVDRVRGFNYSKGKWVTLGLYAVKGGN